MTWEEEARELGIPTDRMQLVKRNLELKAKLESRGKAILTWATSWHESFGHDGAFYDCQRNSCLGTREVLERTKP